jgi:citrate-Mg2+:H+ or citrate-Ca2+:H+ symporter, CitMHS family
MAALKADASVIFNPVVPAMIVGILWVLAVAYILGRRERARLGTVTLGSISPNPQPASLSAAATPGTVGTTSDDESDGSVHTHPGERKVALEQPWLFWFNALLTAGLVIALLLSLMPLPVLFILAFAIAFPMNYPSWEQQQKHLVSHAGSVVTVSTMIFAAGIFTGVLSGTKMIEAMAAAVVSVIPTSLAGYLPLIVAVTGMPLSLVFTPDAYYFGVLPVLAQAASSFGLDPVLVGRGAILGQMTTGFPLSPLTASTFILIGLSGVDLGDHQRFIFPWAFGTTLVMTAVAYATGVLSG